MKCVRNPASQECKRVDDAEARKLVGQYGWEYISKSDYRKYQVGRMQELRHAS